MGIDGNAGHAESVAEHDVRGFPPDPMQGHQVLHPRGDYAVVPFDEVSGKSEERFGLGAEKPRGPNEILNPLAGSGREGARVRVGGEEGGRDLIDPDIGALRGENGCDEQLERVVEIELAARVGILISEKSKDPPGAFLERR